MPVFRAFLNGKGVKIPKIVTYHTTVKTIFMRLRDALFRAVGRGLSEGKNGRASGRCGGRVRRSGKTRFGAAQREGVGGVIGRVSGRRGEQGSEE